MKEKALEYNIQQFQKGDVAAFEALYDAYAPSLYGICVKMIGDYDDANDVLQDSFVKIWTYAKKFDAAKGTFFTWMLNITRNTAIDKKRKKSGGKNLSFQPIQNEVSDVSMSDAMVKDQPNVDTIGLKELLKTMPQEQQTIIEYLYFKGYTQQETSDELNIPLGTVKTRSRSALKHLKELFALLIGWM